MTSESVLARLLGDIPPRKFLDDYFFRLPFALPGGAGEFVEFGGWPTVDAILASPDADALVVREGQRWPEDRTPTVAEARRLFAEGHTLLVRHAERHDARLAALAADFARDFRAAVDVHVYCTPAGRHGFGWHYDAEDVFILQTAGRKEYSFRKNTVNPWPVVEALPADMRYERELMPLLQCLLAAGDWLYIPHGYWHMARAAEDSISLAVGVLAPSGLDALDFLRERLVPSMLWRQRLPVAGEAAATSEEALLAEFRARFVQLADDLTAHVESEAFARQFLARIRR
ncbi:MAG: cupin domain-containing protein [Planctomycetales bacterium]